MRSPLHDLRPVGLQPAVEVVQPQAREAAGDDVEDPRRDPAGERVAPLRLPAGDEVEALVELGEQPRDLGGIVLEVAVDRDDDLALRLLEARLQRRRLAEVPPQPDDANAVVRGVQPGQRGERAVGGAVVDEDDLPRARRAGRAPPQARRAGARRSAPRRARGRSPRSRPLAYAPDAPVALDRRRPRARARAGPAARRGARSGRRCGGPGARGGRRGACRSAAVRELGDGRLRGPRRRCAGQPCRSSSGSPPACPPTGRSRRARRWRSRPGAPCPREPTRSCRSSMLSNKTTGARSRIQSLPGRTSGPIGGDVRAGDALLAGRHGARRRTDRRARRGRHRRGLVRPAARGSSFSAPARSCARRARRSGPGRSTSRTADARGRVRGCGRARRADRPGRRRRGRRIERALERGLEADVLVSSGGVSVGPHDLVRRVLARARRRGGLLGRGRPPGQAARVRRPRRDARLRTARETRSRRSSRSSCSCGRRCSPCRAPRRPGPSYESGAARVRRCGGTRARRARPRAHGSDERRDGARAGHRPGVAHDRPRRRRGRARARSAPGRASSQPASRVRYLPLG